LSLIGGRGPSACVRKEGGGGEGRGGGKFLEERDAGSLSQKIADRPSALKGNSKRGPEERKAAFSYLSEGVPRQVSLLHHSPWS